MKKQLLALVLTIGINFISYSQDTIRIKHTNYTTVFSKSLRYPVLVEWWETKEKVECSKPLNRKNQFAPDPLIHDLTNLETDYKGAGLDRGHMCPAASNECQTPQVEAECFYFSNMTPQYHSLNAGDFKSVEVLERKISIDNDSVHIWAGSIGVSKKIGRVSVPKQCWKVIYIVKTKEYLAFLFDNTPNKSKGINNVKVTIETIEKLTGFKFN